MRKYKITKNVREFLGETLHQIQALKDFSDVKKGELGGWIEKEMNLSQDGNCWISGDARVFGDARVYGDAIVCGDAIVYGYAEVCDDAKVHGDSKVFGDAAVYGNARVSGDAKIFGYAMVYGHAIVYGNAKVYGDAEVYGNAEVSEEQTIKTGYITKSLKDLKYSIMAQLGIYPKDKMKLYKSVIKIKKGRYKTMYNFNDFIYEDGKIAKVKNPDLSNESCSSGIHLSTPLYWDSGDTIIECEVNFKDIITCQCGKIRCKKCKVIGEVFKK